MHPIRAFKIILCMASLTLISICEAKADQYLDHGWTCAKVQEKLNKLTFPNPAKFEGFEAATYNGTYLFGRCEGGFVIVDTSSGQVICKGWIQGGSSSQSFYGYDPDTCTKRTSAGSSNK